MPPRKLSINQDKTGDLLFAIGVGFLINFVLGVVLPEVAPFIAGIVTGVMVKGGPFRGGLAGVLAGTLGGLASLGLWLSTNLFGLPASLTSSGFTYAIAILIAEYAILSLSGGMIGSVVASARLADSYRLFRRHNLPGFPSLPASPATPKKQED